MGKHKSYPRVGAKYPRQGKASTCEICKQHIIAGEKRFAIDLQWSWFRGDDSVITCCKNCEPTVSLNQLTTAAKSHSE